MDARRAQEIASSPSMVNVTYNGAAIYIEDVDYTNETARVHFIDNPQEIHEVKVTNLIER